MRTVIMSDIHGSFYYGSMIPEIVEREQAEQIILLGDLYYHGPRNALPETYDTMKVAEILNGFADRLLVVRGNCDAEVDEVISEFPFHDHLLLELDGKKVYCTHGHRFNMESPPAEAFDMMFYGHFHTGFIRVRGSQVFANPGSLSLPRNGTRHSYLLLDHGQLTLKDVSGEVLDTLESM